MKMPHPATSVPISSPIQLHLSQMLTTTKQNMGFSDYQTTIHSPKTVTLWPDTNTPQMEINRALLINDFLPTAP
jgi:hypothetical protein